MDKIQKLEVAILALAICLYGSFYDGFAGLIGIGLIVALLMRLHNSKELAVFVPKSLLLWGLMLLPLAALVTALYAVDSGMAVMGWLKFLPLPFFILLVSQEKQDFREKTLRIVPDVAVCITVIGLATWFTPVRDYFYINERFSGIFQYANGYALFLLIALLLLLWDAYGWKSFVKAGIIVCGILATGSRAVFFLMLVSILVWVLLARSNGWSRNKKIGILLGFGGIITMSLLLAVVSGNEQLFSRYTHLYAKSSSLMGRLLYNIDGLQIIYKHPFGLGYKGYSFYEGAVQTGNYSVTFVHNELLQVALDFGVVMGLLIGAGWLFTILRKDTPLRTRMILTVVGVHGLFDWSLQFVAVLMIVALLLIKDDTAIKIQKDRIKGYCFKSICLISMIGALWLGTASILEFAGDYQTAAKIWPGLTTSQMRIINNAGSDTEKYMAAERICSQNDHCTIALQALAEQAARNGEFAKMEDYGRKSMLSSKYNKAGYEIYIYLLSFAIESCQKQGNEEEARRYMDCVCEVENQIRYVEETTSPYAKYLYNKPEIKLDEQYELYISNIRDLLKERS